VLQAAVGLGSTAIAAGPGIAKHTVGKWRERFARQRTCGLLGEPRPGAPRRIRDEQITALVDRTLAERPEGSTHRSPQAMAQLEDYLEALAYRFTPEDAALVDRLVTPGHPSTPSCIRNTRSRGW
jgi:transposase